MAVLLLTTAGEAQRHSGSAASPRLDACEPVHRLTQQQIYLATATTEISTQLYTVTMQNTTEQLQAETGTVAAASSTCSYAYMIVSRAPSAEEARVAEGRTR
jgi:hypothetical protein